MQVFCQNSNLVILNNDNQKFKFTIDKEIYNNTFAEKVVIKDLQSENFSIHLEFDNDSIGLVNQKLFVGESTTYYFTFVKNEGASFNSEKNNYYQLKLLGQIPSSKFESDKKNDDLIFDEFVPNEYEISLIDKLNNIEAGKKKEISEIVTCVAPLNFKDFEDIKLIIENVEKEEEKTKLVKKFIDNKCLSSQQLYFLLLNVKNESDKINIIKHCEYKIYNPEDFALLTELIKDPFIRNELKSLAYR